MDEEYKDFSDRIFRYYVRQVCLKGSSTCDQDCYGRWSSCTEDCEEGDEREFIEEVPQNGLGEQCPDNDKAPSDMGVVGRYILNPSIFIRMHNSHRPLVEK